MKDNYSHIVMLLDRSGSMKKLSADTIGGFNSFLAEQKKVPGEATFTLATFSTDYNLIHDMIPLSDVKDLTEEDFNCNGFTALNDAVGRTINNVGYKLSAMKEEDRPSKVIFVIMTDGEENRSYKFSKQQIVDMVSHQTDKYDWSFSFLGAGIDAFKEGEKVGVAGGNSYSYAAAPVATRSTFNLLHENMKNYRASSSVDKNDFFKIKNINDIKKD